MKRKFIAFLHACLLALFLVGCKGNTSADLVVYGKIYTSEDNKVVEAFAVKDGKYVYVGDKAGAEAYVEEGKGVLNPIVYPIIVAASVVTTFLTPYIMKAAVPCYTFLYNHASEGLRAKIDQREQQVAAAEAEAANPSGDKNSLAGKARHAVRHTFFLKHLVNLFIKNMSAHDEEKKEK